VTAEAIARTAARHGLEPALLAAVVRADGQVATRAARGPLHLMPSVARALGAADPADPAGWLDAAARHLRAQLDALHGDVRLALAAYEAGLDAVLRHDGVPPYSETLRYVPIVMAYYEEILTTEGRC
jgi:soluble lytic murein transglycosylase-like protein